MCLDYDSIAKVLRGESTLDEETHKEQLRLIQFFSEDISKEIDFNVIFPKLVEDDWLGRYSLTFPCKLCE